MANEPKTPGEELYRHMSIALRWRPMAWEQLPDERREDMEAVAQKLREQVLVEVQAKLIAEERFYSKHHAGWVNDYEILTDVIRIAAAPIRVP